MPIDCLVLPCVLQRARLRVVHPYMADEERERAIEPVGDCLLFPRMVRAHDDALRGARRRQRGIERATEWTSERAKRLRTTSVGGGRTGQERAF